MKNRVFKAIIIMVIMAFGLSGCKNGTGNEMSEVVNNTQVGNEADSDKVEVEAGEIEHTHSYTSEVTKEATCSEMGTITYTCKCGNAYKEDIAALGHQYGEYIYNNDATTSSDGTKTATCATCGESDTVVATGTMIHQHSYVETITKDASCESKGVKTFTCECGDTYKEDIVATGHQYGEYIYNNDATTSSDGTKTAICVLCGKKNTVVANGTMIKNVFYNPNNIVYNTNQVTISPLQIYWENGMLYAKCAITNGYNSVAYNIDVRELTFSNDKGLIAGATFGVLNKNLSIAPKGYVEWTFIFSGDAIVNPQADLSKTIKHYYSVYNNY